MTGAGFWLVNKDKPERLKRGRLSLERELEDWIELDPDLVQPGLKIVGRQLRLGAGRIDLLALTPDGTWTIIELKRDKPRRETIGQILDYVSSFKDLSSQELEKKIDAYLVPRNHGSFPSLARRFGFNEANTGRQYQLLLVGTYLDPELQEICSYLQGQGVPVAVVTIDVFENTSGQRVIVRETQEDSVIDPSVATSTKEMRKVALAYGVDKEFDLLVSAANRHGLFSRVFQKSVGFTPYTHKNRPLFSVRLVPYQGGVEVFVSPQTFAEFYPPSEEDVIKHLGNEGIYEMDFASVKKFVSQLDDLFAAMMKRPE